MSFPVADSRATKANISKKINRCIFSYHVYDKKCITTDQPTLLTWQTMLHPTFGQGLLDIYGRYIYHWYTGWSRKTAQSFAYDNFWTIRHSIAQFAPKCLAEISYCWKTQNFYVIKYSLLNSWKRLHVISDVNTAPLTDEDWSLIQVSWTEKEWTVDRMIAQFPARQWKWLPGSSRRRSVKTDSNVKLVNDLICNQEGQLGTSKSPQEIARETRISHSSVARIAKKDLQLSVFHRCEVQSLSTWSVKK